MSKKLKMIESTANVFANMGFSEEEAKELQCRSFLMTVIERYIKSEGLTQKEAAQKLGVTQSRVSNLVRGKIDLFSISMLLAMLERAGFNVYENLQEKPDVLLQYRDVNIFPKINISDSQSVVLQHGIEPLNSISQPYFKMPMIERITVISSYGGA